VKNHRKNSSCGKKGALVPATGFFKRLAIAEAANIEDFWCFTEKMIRDGEFKHKILHICSVE
jgi:hypothetical protein